MSNDGPPLPPPSGPPTRPVDQGAQQPANPWWKQWYTFVGAAVVVLLVTAGAVIVGGGSDDSSPSGAATGSTTASTTESTTESTATPATSDAVTTSSPATIGSTTATTEPAATMPATTAAPTTVAATPAGFGSCRYTGVDDFGDMQIELEFANAVGSVPTLEVTYALVDGADVRFLTDSEFVELPGLDERFRIVADTLEALPADVDEGMIGCAILEITDAGFGADDAIPAGADDACQFVEVDDFGDVQVELTITSQFPSTTDIAISYALSGPDGVRFGSGSAITELVESGQTVRLAEDTFTERPEWVGNDVSCAVLGVEPIEV